MECCSQLLLPSPVNLRLLQKKKKKNNKSSFLTLSIFNGRRQRRTLSSIPSPLYFSNFLIPKTPFLPLPLSSCVATESRSSAGISFDTTESAMQVEDISVASAVTEAKEIKIRIDVSGARTQAIFDNVFSKMVDAAQPIPGFRRVKGGKTPNIPKDALLHILGPSKVYNKVIKKVINTAIAEYVEKENLKVTKDLKVEQSYEELEETFEPGFDFSFDAVIHLQD